MTTWDSSQSPLLGNTERSWSAGGHSWASRSLKGPGPVPGPPKLGAEASDGGETGAGPKPGRRDTRQPQRQPPERAITARPIPKRRSSSTRRIGRIATTDPTASQGSTPPLLDGPVRLLVSDRPLLRYPPWLWPFQARRRRTSGLTLQKTARAVRPKPRWKAGSSSRSEPVPHGVSENRLASMRTRPINCAD